MTVTDSRTNAAAQDERLLVRDVKSGDRRAFEALYRMHVDRVYGLCFRMMGNRADADDCSQDTFVRAWQRIDGFRGDSAFGTWLHRIAVNECLTRQRKLGRERQHLSLADSFPGVASAPDTHDTQIDELEKAIAGLPDGARNVFVLLAVYGYSHDEAGKMLDIAPGTSKAQLHRAKRLLVAKLGEETVNEDK